MASRVDHDWSIVRHLDSQGAVIAKLGNRPLISEEVAGYDDFVIEAVPDASALTDHDIDRSGLSDEELQLINRLQDFDHS